MRHRDLMPAMLIFSAALAAFTWIAATVETDGMLTSIDAWVGTWLHLHAMPPITQAMIVISFLGAPSTLTAVTAVVCVVLVRKRSYDRLVALVMLVLGGNLLNYGLKLLIHRGRPTFEDPLLSLPSYSFPSGHAMASTIFYRFAIAFVLTTRRQRHNAATAAGILMIGLVCLRRVYLGVHYASDVLGGILEAIAWSTLALTALRLARVHQRSIASRRQAE
jgi:membrane-associated phospholipid phosphatase